MPATKSKPPEKSKGKQYAKTAPKSGKEKARQQMEAIALGIARGKK